MTLNMQRKPGKPGRGIEWTDATWNPIAGCPHQCRWTMPDGDVAICYAEDIAEGMAHRAYSQGFAHHYWKPLHLNSPHKAKGPLKIFVGSMSDVFAHRVPLWQIDEILQVARECPQHTFQMLTKNPIMAKHFYFPENVWLGASSPPDFMQGKKLSQHQKDRLLEASLKALSQTNATVKFMSFEPLSWDVMPIVEDYGTELDWAIIGAASNGPKKYQPDPSHLSGLLQVLDSQNIPVFFKGNLEADNWREEFPVARYTKPLMQQRMF